MDIILRKCKIFSQKRNNCKTVLDLPKKKILKMETKTGNVQRVKLLADLLFWVLHCSYFSKP